MKAIEIKNLTREFKYKKQKIVALDDVSINVSAGECVALLGKNGAGKTTLAKILSTLLLPTNGIVSVFGNDVVLENKKVRKLISTVFGGDKGFYPVLSGKENLLYQAALLGLSYRDAKKRVLEIGEVVGLSDSLERPVEQYSKGMKQRLHIAGALLKHAPVLVLDEPTVGLDPLEANKLRKMVQLSIESGTTVLLTSHNLQDVEFLADRILILKEGKIKAAGTVEEFRSIIGYKGIVTFKIPNARIPLLKLTNFRFERSSDADGFSAIKIFVKDWSPETFGLLQNIQTTMMPIDLKIRSVSLDESFEEYFLRSDQK